MPVTDFFHRLDQLAAKWASRRLIDVFQQDRQRQQNFCETINGLCFDYSRNFIDEPTLDTLLAWVDASGIADAMPLWQQQRRLDCETHLWQRAADLLGYQSTQEPLALIHLGTGGMHTPHRALASALQAFRLPNVTLRFIASPEAAALDHALSGLNPHRVQIIIASTSFATASTLEQAHRARAWLLRQLPAA